MAIKAGGLTAQGVKNAGPGVHGDGGGLYLRVKPDGRAAWVLRYQLEGVRRDLGLGRARGPGAVTLADVRRQAEDARRLIADGKDPLKVRDANAAARRIADAAVAKVDAISFRTIADEFLMTREGGWRNDKHRLQWSATLTTYVHPHLGALPVDRIEVADVLRVLRPIWETKPETAARVRGRVENVLSFAAALRHRPQGHNPATWKGVLDAILPPVAKMKAKVREASGRSEHHAALAWEKMPDFMRVLRARDGAAALALRFTILTAARTNEVLGATWAEVDEVARVWTIPATKMKAGAEHRVPLTDASLAILAEAADRNSGREGAIFQAASRPLSIMAMTMAVRRMQGEGELRWTDTAGRPITVHGFRSTFRDFASERVGAAREVAEAALAHTVGSKVEAAYRRGDMLERRRPLMEQWSGWCAGTGQAEGAVVHLHRQAG